MLSHHPTLPRFPLPSLEASVQRVLESVRPLSASEQEFEALRIKAEAFLSGRGQVLQERLEERARAERNWFVSCLSLSCESTFKLMECRRQAR